METELWRCVAGFEWIYEISSNGRVRSLDRWIYHNWNKSAHKIKGRILKTRINNCGYEDVRLYKQGRACTKFIHRLMSEAFIPQPPGKNETNHIDGVKLNNSLDNLEWVTHSENMLHAYNHGLIVKLKKQINVK